MLVLVSLKVSAKQCTLEVGGSVLNLSSRPAKDAMPDESIEKKASVLSVALTVRVGKKAH